MLNLLILFAVLLQFPCARTWHETTLADRIRERPIEIARMHWCHEGRCYWLEGDLPMEDGSMEVGVYCESSCGYYDGVGCHEKFTMWVDGDERDATPLYVPTFNPIARPEFNRYIHWPRVYSAQYLIGY